MKILNPVLITLSVLVLAVGESAAAQTPSPTPVVAQPSPTLAPQQRQEVQQLMEAELEKSSKISDRVQATVNSNFGWAIGLLTALIAVIGVMPLIIGVFVWLLRGGVMQQIVTETKKQIEADIEKEVKAQLHAQVSLELDQQVNAFRTEIAHLKSDFLQQLENLFITAQQEKAKIFEELSRITPSVIQEEFVTPEVQAKIQELTKQLESLKTSTIQLWLTGEDYVQQGDALYFESRYDEAVTSYDKAIQINRDLFTAWLGKAKTLRRAQRYDEALFAHDQAINLKPDNYWAWFGRGLTLADMQRYEEALIALNQAIAINPKKHHAWKTRGYALTQLGRYDEALADFDQALEIKPHSSGAHFSKTYYYLAQNQLDLAFSSLQQAIGLNPNHRDHAKSDPNFARILTDQRFQALLFEQ